MPSPGQAMLARFAKNGLKNELFWLDKIFTYSIRNIMDVFHLKNIKASSICNDISAFKIIGDTLYFKKRIEAVFHLQ